jgi:hypothetical protein
MGHIKPELITDLNSELDIIRLLPLIKEKKKGVFYIKSAPFLHFHDKEGIRWAHVKDKKGDWIKFDLPFEASSSTKKKFIKFIKNSYDEIKFN